MSKADSLRLPEYLGHILQAIERIYDYIEEIDEVAFLQDTKTQDAVIRNFGIIGAASNAIKRHHAEFASQHPEIKLNFAYEMRNALAHGYFKVDLEIVWRTIHNDLPELHRLALMQKFELCYLLPDTQPKLWLAPQLLPPSKPVELNGWATAGDLVLRYRYEFLPKGMINRLMVRLHRFVPRPELGWLTGVLFERDGTKVLVEIPAKGGEIMLRAKGLERKELLCVIAADLDALNETFKGLPEKVSKLVPCNCGFCIQQTEPKFFEHKDLLRRKEVGKTTIECPASFDNVNVLKLLDGIQVTEMPDWSIEQTIKKIFISYSKKDIDYKDSLINHLTGLRGKIVTWNDRDILPGEEWDKNIKEELGKADIVLYLVSADSMDTGYIQQVELPMILQRCDAGECKLVPIIVRACDWQEQGFAKYNVLPAKGKHIKSWADEDEAWLEVVQGIKKIIA